MKRSLLLFFVLLIIFFPKQNINAQWVQTNGPSGHGGAVYSICFQDSNIFVTTNGGIYLTKNNARTWLKINKPNDLPNNISGSESKYVTANEENIFATYSGVFKSSDEGMSWTLLKQPSSFEGNYDIVDASGDWIIVCSHSGSALYQSTDGGTEWWKLSNAGKSVLLQDSIGLIGTSQGILISTNYGTTWNFINTQYSYSSSFAVSGSRIFAGINNYILSSTDKGVTWGADSTTLNCKVINSIVFSPAGSGFSFVFAATDSGIYRSSDDGATWLLVNNGVNSKLIFSLGFKIWETGGIPVLYAGTGDGLYRSSDYGETWNVVGVPSGNWSLASSNNILYAGTSIPFSVGLNVFDNNQMGVHPEIYYSTDEGIEWIRSDEGLSDQNVQISSLAANSEPGANNIFVSAGYRTKVKGTIFKSSKDGTTWTNIFNDSSYSLVSTVAFNNNIIFAGTYNGVIFSSDNGESWTENDSAMNLPIVGNIYKILNVKAFSFDNKKIFAAEGDSPSEYIPGYSITTVISNRIIVSSDNGISWSKVDSKIPSGLYPVNSSDTLSILTCLYADSSHLIVGMRAYNYYSAYKPTGGCIYHLVNKDSNWVVADSALIGKQVFCLTGIGKDVFAGTTTGIYHSSDYGATWTEMNSGLLDKNVTSMVINGSYLYAATSSGIWKFSLPEITSVKNERTAHEAPSGFILSQNFPNPFNPKTTISYSIPQTNFVTIKVYDVLGKEVATLVNEVKSIGNYNVEFNASILTSGIYFYRMQAGSFVETKKLILLK